LCARAQVVGWPPIRSFRKNSLATNSKNNEEVDGKVGVGALFIKVSMDGAPYLRKVDLNNYSTYPELSSALEKMFSCFTISKTKLVLCEETYAFNYLRGQSTWIQLLLVLVRFQVNVDLMEFWAGKC